MTPRFTAEELSTLLGRPPRAAVTPGDRQAYAGRRVLITGAAGSIGSELARELARCAPERLAIVDQSELGLFTIERELRARHPDLDLDVHLTDVSHRQAFDRVIRAASPHVVFHAAAYKHVTMAERAPAAAVRVNVTGSVYAAAAAARAGARFVLISSDKAADPGSVMGATKRVAEMATRALASPSFRPIVVRFGNVLGSSGSVLEVLRASIRAGQPVPVTDPDATRYFMTDGEAVALVLRADQLARAAAIYWLDMGAPVRIGDLVDRVIAAEARAGFPSTGTAVLGLRPGEKRDETLTDSTLVFERTLDDRVLVAREARCDRAAVMAGVARLEHAARQADDEAAVAALVAMLPGFEPSEQARGKTRAAAPRTAWRPVAGSPRGHAA